MNQQKDNSRSGRDSPPPGHFHQLDRNRSGSTASTRSKPASRRVAAARRVPPGVAARLACFLLIMPPCAAPPPGIFHEISGGGEFIPENMSGSALPPSPGGYSFISEVRAHGRWRRLRTCTCSSRDSAFDTDSPFARVAHFISGHTHGAVHWQRAQRRHVLPPHRQNLFRRRRVS